MAQSAPNSFTTLTACRACHSKNLEPVLDLGNQYIVGFPAQKDENLPRAPIRLVRCDACNLLQLRDSVLPDLLWREYWYRSGINATMREHLTDVVRRTCQWHEGGAWLDIGANDGTLLSKVPDSYTKIACEPALNLKPQLEEHADMVFSDYFKADLFNGAKFNVITSLACFYDVNDPEQWVADAASLLTDSGVWINEVADANAMLRNNAFDAVCHEHATYWDVWALKSLYEKHGLHIESVHHNDINGGSIQIAAVKYNTQPDLAGISHVTRQSAHAFAKRIYRWREEFRNLVFDSPIRKHPLWGLGASTKGQILLQYLDASDRFVAVADRNPAKYGLTMAGSWLPIVDEATLRAAEPRYVVPLIWAFRDEILQREANLRDSGAAMLFPLPNIEMVL